MADLVLLFGGAVVCVFALLGLVFLALLLFGFAKAVGQAGSQPHDDHQDHSPYHR